MQTTAAPTILVGSSKHTKHRSGFRRNVLGIIVIGCILIALLILYIARLVCFKRRRRRRYEVDKGDTEEKDDLEPNHSLETAVSSPIQQRKSPHLLLRDNSDSFPSPYTHHEIEKKRDIS